MKIRQVYRRSNKMIGTLLKIWESSMRDTHCFLTEEDIRNIRREVIQGITQIECLSCFYDTNNKIKGFIGIEDKKIEMLFVDNKSIGQGIGKKLLHYATSRRKAKYVDVNEQNIQGFAFYSYMGFSIIDRSELDSKGRNFPILHLKKEF